MSQQPRPSHFMEFYRLVSGRQRSFSAINTAAMCVIYVAPGGPRPVSISDVARDLGCSYGVAWATVTRLVNAGLVERHEFVGADVRTDGVAVDRVALVRLTEAGEAAMRALHGDAPAVREVPEDDPEPAAD